MKFFEATFGTIVNRFFLMMAVIILAGFTGQWWIAFLAFPILMSAMMGINFKSNNKKLIAKRSTIDPSNKIETA